MNGMCQSLCESLHSHLEASLSPSRCSPAKFKSLLFGLLPVLSWLPKYKIKDYIIPDVLGGLSGGCIQVPQGEGDLPQLDLAQGSWFPSPTPL